MALGKDGTTFYFGKGLDLKTDPNLIPAGEFQSLSNCIFDTIGQLRKRNGFGILTSTVGSISYLTTFQNNLIGLGSNIQSYSTALNTFIPKGLFPQIQVTVTPVSNALFGYTECDQAISNNGLICVTSAQVAPPAVIISGLPLVFNYQIIEQATGQILSGPNQINGSGGSVITAARVFAVGSQFCVVYQNSVGSSSALASTSWLQYITIPTSSPFVASNVLAVSSNSLTSTVITPGILNNSFLSFDGAVASTSGLYLSWLDHTGQDPLFTIVNPVTQTNSGVQRFGGNFSSTVALSMNVCADYTQTPYTFWNAIVANQKGIHAFAAIQANGNALTTTSFLSCSGSMAINSTSFYVNNIAMTAQNGSMTAYIEIANNYVYDTSIPTNVIAKMAVNQNAPNGSIVADSTSFVIGRGLGIVSKGFIFNSTSYVMATYVSPYQSTYFMINSTGQVQAKLAYGNANPSYANSGLSSVNVVGSSAYFPYLIQNTISPVGKLTNTSSQTGIYGKLGINIAQLNFNSPQGTPKELGQNLMLGGGFLGAYDGQQFTENDFFLFPDSVEATPFAAGGGLSAQVYSYVATYEWPDNKGNIFRSAPSIPISVTATTSASSVFVRVPTLRISYKNWPYGGSSNTPVQVKLYRWSQALQIYYFNQQFTQDITALNSDYTFFADTFNDNQILGNQILYTNGGTVEDVNGPATKAMATFDSRLWLIDAEDQNLLWFSKQVIENTPVEMSDLFTFYVAPNIGAEGPTGVMNCLAPMDDKLVIFKSSALYYINGVGPDNTGATNQYSQPIFITSAVGCNNQNSIVLIDKGLMFQSNKGIWLLGRDLSPTYVGKEVETLVNANTVLSAITIPNTNQVRFTLNTGVTLLYDYFVGQWGTFNGISGISSALYNGLHTYVNGSSSVLQETPGIYMDGTSPTLMSFTTGWMSLAGLQGYKRAYKAYLLGNYYTPHNFTLGIGYDYNPAIAQTITVNPTNTVGSGSQVEQWELNFDRQQCQSLQLTFNEVSSQSAGQGLTVSGLDLVFGVKKKYPRNLGPKNKTS